MNPGERAMLAGVDLPTTPAIERAMAFARERCEDYLFNHVMRSWHFAGQIALRNQTGHDPEVVAIAVLLHDVTLNSQFAGPRRFEVEAADIARDFALGAGLDERRAQLVWDGVALNSTPSIGLHKEAEVSLATAGICLDVVGLQSELLSAAEIDAIVARYPRLAMKRRMTDCFCQVAANVPQASYDNFLRDFGERFVAGYRPPSAVDLVAQAPFGE